MANSGQITLRRAEPRDFNDVLELATQLAVHIEAPVPPLTPQRFAAFYLDENAPMQLRLAEQDGRVTGLIAWTLTHELYSADARVYISDLAVRHNARGYGTGAALMSGVEAWARARGVQKMGWEVWRHNASAKAFYQRLGARIDDEAIAWVMDLTG